MEHAERIKDLEWLLELANERIAAQQSCIASHEATNAGLDEARREERERLAPWLMHLEGCCVPLIKAVGAQVENPCNCGLDNASPPAARDGGVRG